MADNRLKGVLRDCAEAFLGHIPCVTQPSLLAENALCFIKIINSAAPGGTMLASHPQLSACKTHKGRCLLEQYRCWPGWYLLKQWTGCNWLLNAVFTLTDIWLVQLQMSFQSFSEPDSLIYQPAVLLPVTSTKYPSSTAASSCTSSSHYSCSWSIAVVGKEALALPAGSLQEHSTYKYRSIRWWQSWVPQRTLGASLAGR